MLIQTQINSSNLPSMLKTRQNPKGKEESIAHDAIFVGIAVFILFIESLVTLLLSVKKGIFRKEVLTQRTNLGFDVNIIVKD